MEHRHVANSGLGGIGLTCAFLILIVNIVGCEDTAGPSPVADLIRSVKTIIVSPPDTSTGIDLPARIRTAQPSLFAFEAVSGQLVELPIAGREGQKVMKGELLAQIDPRPFEAALRDAENKLKDAYSGLEMARAENERMEKMKGINPDLVSTSMLERTKKSLSQAKARLGPLEIEVDKAEDLLEYSSLRALYAGIIVRCLVEDSQFVQASEPVVELQDTTHLEVLVDASQSVMEAVRELEPKDISAVARFPTAPGREFSLRLKKGPGNTGPADGSQRILLEMPRPKEIELLPGVTGTVSLISKKRSIRAGPVLIPAIAVMTDPDSKDYVWVVNEAELRVHRQDVRLGRLAGSDQIQVMSGLVGGERIVVAGVLRLAEGRQVRLWDDGQDAGKAK